MLYTWVITICYKYRSILNVKDIKINQNKLIAKNN